MKEKHRHLIQSLQNKQQILRNELLLSQVTISSLLRKRRRIESNRFSDKNWNNASNSKHENYKNYKRHSKAIGSNFEIHKNRENS